MHALTRKVPSALFVAALVVAGVGVVQQRHAERDVVSAAIAAPQPDVGIGTIEDTLTFWQQRVIEQPSDDISTTNLAKALLGRARKTGNLSLYPKAEQLARQVLEHNPNYEAALLTVASARGANHDFAEARNMAEIVLARNPTSQAAKESVPRASAMASALDIGSAVPWPNAATRSYQRATRE